MHYSVEIPSKLPYMCHCFILPQKMGPISLKFHHLSPFFRIFFMWTDRRLYLYETKMIRPWKSWIFQAGDIIFPRPIIFSKDPFISSHSWNFQGVKTSLKLAVHSHCRKSIAPSSLQASMDSWIHCWENPWWLGFLGKKFSDREIS